MKNLKTIGILLSMMLTTAVHAQKKGGYGMGNGGDAVVCYTDATRSKITSVQLLDYWEQEQVVHYGPVDLGAATLSVQDKIQVAVNRIAKFDPELAQRIQFHALNLANNIQNYLVTSYQLPEIDDANPLVIPTKKNCFIEQYGVQYKDLITGQRRFIIADKFYNFSGTSNDDKAGLLLHEAIYRYAILQNPALNSSDGIRYFNYVLSSQYIETLSLTELDRYITLLKLAGIENAKCGKWADPLYVKSNMYETCYNQKVEIAPGITIEVLNSTRITYSVEFGKVSRLSFGYPHTNFMPTVEIGNSKFLSKKHLNIDLRLHSIDLDIDTYSGAPFILRNGPLDLDYECSVGFVYDFVNKAISICRSSSVVSHKGQNFKFSSIQNLDHDRWKIQNDSYVLNPTFAVLGSQKNIRFMLDNGAFATIDSNLNAVEGHVFLPLNSNQLEVNGFRYGVNEFQVVQSGSNYVLNFQTAVPEISPPLNLGYRVLSPVKYPASFAEIDELCRLYGYEKAESIGSVSEYVGGLGESFYDTTTLKTTYKADEDVKYISTLRCKSMYLRTTDY